MKKIILGLIPSILLSACQYKKDSETDELQVNQVTMESHDKKRLDVSVVNDLDPICKMKTADYLSDTARYNEQIYGFCSKMCKDEFVRHPSKYTNE